MIEDLTSVQRDPSDIPEMLMLTHYIYQPFWEAYDALEYPSIWAARCDDRYATLLEGTHGIPWGVEDAPKWLRDQWKHLVEEEAWEYIQSKVVNGEFYTLLSDRIEIIAIKLAVLVDIATVQAGEVGGGVLEEGDEIPSCFKDLPTYEGAGTALMEQTIKRLEAEYYAALSKLHLIRRSEFLQTNPGHKFAVVKKSLSAIVNDALSGMQRHQEPYSYEDFQWLTPDNFTDRITGTWRYMRECPTADPADPELRVIVDTWDQYLQAYSWERYPEAGWSAAVDAIRPLADYIGYNIEHLRSSETAKAPSQ